MRNTLLGLLPILVSMMLLTACETDNEVFLTDGVWTFQDLTSESKESDVISLVSLAKALLTDASMEFQEGGAFILTSPLVENPTMGEWQLIGEDQLVLDPEDEGASTSNIETLTKDKLSYSESFEDGQMNTYTVTTSWTR
jgi:hypothetical protein